MELPNERRIGTLDLVTRLASHMTGKPGHVTGMNAGDLRFRQGDDVSHVLQLIKMRGHVSGQHHLNN